jgi:hypothetical protein
MKSLSLKYSIIIAMFLPTTAYPEIFWETSGFIKNETSVFTREGVAIGARSRHLGIEDEGSHEVGDLLKFENSANLFVNGEFSENTSVHTQLNLIYDSEGINDDYKWHRNYTQNDYLREFYIDHSIGDGALDIRFGKQQVVWGTADGIKLLDIINPTDFREFSQNTMEDSRIPIWMLKLDATISDDTSTQFILSRFEGNKIPGLEAGGDSGHPFLIKGVDSITGQVNGFLNITPALGKTAAAFTNFVPGFTKGMAGKLEAVGGNTFTVQNFVDGFSPFCQGGKPGMPAPEGVNNCAKLLNYVAQTKGKSLMGTELGGNDDKTNLVEETYDAGIPDNTFEYMAQASFSTFDTFANARTKYIRDYPEDTNPNVGFRLKSSVNENFKYSLNYFYHYDANPSVSIHWEDATGNELTPFLTSQEGVTGETVHTVRLRKPDGNTFIASDPLNVNDGPATLVFKEELHRIHSLGAAFDTSIDTHFLGPIVLRGEFLYDKDVRVPVIDRDALAVGNLAAGLRPEKADFVKYVLGLDITVLTNLMISTQVIQFFNLDYIDEAGSGLGKVPNTGRYTADPATLHLGNNLQRGQRLDNFFSLFLSKPFGEAQLGRINNLTLVEEGGGFWNRLDLEYGFTDSFIGTAELNHYWGNEYTTFGQLNAASNFQLGIKYLFE